MLWLEERGYGLKACRLGEIERGDEPQFAKYIQAKLILSTPTQLPKLCLCSLPSSLPLLLLHSLSALPLSAVAGSLLALYHRHKAAHRSIGTVASHQLRHRCHSGCLTPSHHAALFSILCYVYPALPDPTAVDYCNPSRQLAACCRHRPLAMSPRPRNCLNTCAARSLFLSLSLVPLCLLPLFRLRPPVQSRPVTQSPASVSYKQSQQLGPLFSWL